MGIIDTIREAVRAAMHQEARFINWASRGAITANHVTWASVVLHIPIALAIVAEEYQIAAAMLAVFGLLDAVDGQLARMQDKVSNYGVFLDSTTDRIKESLVYLPLTYVFASQTLPYETLVTGIAATGALITSYARARGESVLQHTKISASETNQIFKGGLARFEVRLSVMFFGLLFEAPAVAVTIVALTSWLTIGYRMMMVIRAVK